MSKNNKFVFVGQERKVYDQEIEGKPIGYFKDAMIRFRKNKMNIAAAIILSILILMAIFVPIFTNKNYEVIEEQLTYLSPRVPILEKFGILDGKTTLKKIPVDLDTIDPETNIGLPLGYNKDFITEGTLINYHELSTDEGQTSLGGEVVFSLGEDSNLYRVVTEEIFFFAGEGVKFNVEV